MRSKVSSSALYFSKLRKLHEVLGSEGCLASEVFPTVAEELVCGAAPVSAELRATITSRAKDACTTPVVELQQFYVFVTALLREWTRRLMPPEHRVLQPEQLALLLQVVDTPWQ